MAREIHDTLAQGYTSIIMLAQVARTALEKDRTGELAQRLELIEEVACENLGEARSLVAASAPVGLDGATLTDAVRRLVRRFGAETRIVTQVSVTGEPAGLSRDGEVLLLRSAQEALANVRRHSGARSVTVGLTGTEADARLQVTDDGTGFDLRDTAGPRGFGLAGMRDRAEACGGELSLTSAPGQGTQVAVRVPRGKVIRVLVADDHPIVRSGLLGLTGLTGLLGGEDDMTIVGEAADGAEAVARAGRRGRHPADHREPAEHPGAGADQLRHGRRHRPRGRGRRHRLPAEGH